MPKPNPIKWFPTNPKKYLGDPSNIWARSSWELKIMKWLDAHPDVLSWSSEELIIPYYNPLDNKYHRYYPDFFAKMKHKDGTISNVVIEVKPHYQTIEPKKPDKINKRYLSDLQNWIVNNSKWEAAKKICEEKKWKFTLLTEKTIYGKSNVS